MMELIQFLDLQKTEMNNTTILNDFIRRKVSPNGETGRMLSRLFPLSGEILLTTIHLNIVYSNVDRMI